MCTKQLERMGGGNSRSQMQEEKSEDEIARTRMNVSMRSGAQAQLFVPKEVDQLSETLKAAGPDSLPPVDPREGLTKELDRLLAKLIALCNAPEAIEKWKDEVKDMEKDLHQFKDSIYEARGTLPTGPNTLSQEPSIELSLIQP